MPKLTQPWKFHRAPLRSTVALVLYLSTSFTIMGVRGDEGRRHCTTVKPPCSRYWLGRWCQEPGSTPFAISVTSKLKITYRNGPTNLCFPPTHVCPHCFFPDDAGPSGIELQYQPQPQHLAYSMCMSRPKFRIRGDAAFLILSSKRRHRIWPDFVSIVVFVGGPYGIVLTVQSLSQG